MNSSLVKFTLPLIILEFFILISGRAICEEASDFQDLRKTSGLEKIIALCDEYKKTTNSIILKRLVSLMDDDKFGAKAAAAVGTITIPHNQAVQIVVPSLVKAVTNSNSFIQQAAVQSLGRLGRIPLRQYQCFSNLWDQTTMRRISR